MKIPSNCSASYAILFKQDNYHNFLILEIIIYIFNKVSLEPSMMTSLESVYQVRPDRYLESCFGEWL